MAVELPNTLKPGDRLTAAWLNRVAELAAAARLRVDPSSGLEALASPSGTTIRSQNKLEIWAKITGGGTGGKYDWTEQLEADATGGWNDGTRTGTATVRPAIEINTNASVPTDGSKIVRLWRDRYNWRFYYSACSS